jgi:CHC2 zinc finger/Toprim domain
LIELAIRRSIPTSSPRILKRPVASDEDAGRQFGKMNELSFGFGGGLGAWRRFDPSDNHSDADVERYKTEWRAAHPATVWFWRALQGGMRRAIRSGHPVAMGSLTCTFENGTLRVTLPSGRRLAYPQARLVPAEIEGTTQIMFRDNARGGWRDVRGWHGAFTENVVQAIARDLLAAALIRLEAAGYPIVLHVHDDVVAEVPIGFGSTNEFQRLMTTLPAWADGLPVVAKVWNGPRYAKSKAPAQPVGKPIEPVVSASIIVDTVAPVAPTEAEENKVGQDAGLPPLADLIGERFVDGKICCPFHADRTPSLHVYDDHFHCFGCGAHGDHVDWLMIAEGLSHSQALETLQNWKGRTLTRTRLGESGEANRTRALRLWQGAQRIAGTLAAQYLTEHRRVDLARLPTNVDDVLRFHPRCPFGPDVRHPCLLALMRNVASDEPTGIHRIALGPDGNRIERRLLGLWGAVKLWPAGAQLVVGEGIETVLAAATHISHKGVPLRPAWSAVSSNALGRLPVVADVERLIVLVDHDLNGVGQAAAARCAERWSRAGRNVTQLTPKRPGSDFNDVVIEGTP